MKYRKFMRVLVAFLTAICMLFSFAACDIGNVDSNNNSSNNDSSNSDDSNNDDDNNDDSNDDDSNNDSDNDDGFVMPVGGFDTTSPVTIKFYHTLSTTLSEVLKYHVGEFQKLFPNVEVEGTYIGGYDDVRDRIVADISGGAQPNFSFCYPDHVALFNRSQAVLPLNDFLYNGKYKDMKVAHADGTKEYINLTQAQTGMFIGAYYNEGYEFGDRSTMYTMPFAKSTEVLYYNKTFFEENNLKVPTTWNEMETVMRQIKAVDPQSVPLGYDSEANWFITMCEQLESGYTTAEGDFLFDNDTNKAFVERFKTWYKDGLLTTQGLYGSYLSNLFTATSGQRSYMCIGSSAGAKNQIPTPTNGKYPFEVGITMIPQAFSTDPDHAEYKAGYAPKVISQGPSVCIFKQDDPQEVLASWLLVKYLTTDINFQAEFSATSGYVSVLNLSAISQSSGYLSFLGSANGYANLTALAAQVCMEQQAFYFTTPAFVGSATARDEVGKLMQAALRGAKTVEEAFADALAECEYVSG